MSMFIKTLYVIYVTLVELMGSPNKKDDDCTEKGIPYHEVLK